MLSSIATSAIKNLGIPEATRSIASNAQNVVRVTSARENLENTATSARGRKRTHALVFQNNHTNPTGQYTRYYRSAHYATKRKNNNNTNSNTGSVYHENPATREWKRVKLARFSNTTRKALFAHAVKDRDVAAIARLLREGYVPAIPMCVDAVRAIACLPNALEPVKMIVQRTRGHGYMYSGVYNALGSCSRQRLETLLPIFVKERIVPKYYGNATTDPLSTFIDIALEKGVRASLLNQVSIRSHGGSMDGKEKTQLIARVLTRQATRHPQGGMPKRVREFVDAVGWDTNIESLMRATAHPARLVRWVVDAGHRVSAEDVITALRYHHMPLAVYLASKKTTWTKDDRDDVDSYLRTTRGYGRAQYDQILRQIVGLKQKSSNEQESSNRMRVYDGLESGNTVYYGRQHMHHGKSARVVIPNTNRPGAVKLLYTNRRSPPVRLASQNNFNRWERQHGIVRAVKNSRSGAVRQNPSVPMPNARNLANTSYEQANKAVRTLQAAYRSMMRRKK